MTVFTVAKKLPLFILSNAVLFYSQFAVSIPKDRPTLLIAPVEISLPPVSTTLQDTEARPLPQEFGLAQSLKTHLNQQQYDKALTLLDDKADLSPALLLVKAQLLAQKKYYDDALTAYDEALILMPQLRRAHQGKAIVLLLQKRYREARQAMTQAIQLGLNDANAYTQLAHIHFQMNDAWSAIGAFQQALMLNPDDISLRFGLLSALVKTKQTQSALDLLSSLLDIEPNAIALWLQRASLAMSTDDVDTALSSLETAIRLGDTTPDNVLLTAQLHMQQGNFFRVGELVNLNVEFTPKHYTALLSGLAKHQQWDILARVLTDYSPKVEALAPSDKSRFYLYQAKLAHNNQQPDETIENLKLALTYDPNNSIALLEIAGLFYTQQRYTQAEYYYQRATTFKPSEKQAHLGLAQTYLAQQNYQAALDSLVALSKLEPHNNEIHQNIASVKRVLLAKQ